MNANLFVTLEAGMPDPAKALLIAPEHGTLSYSDVFQRARQVAGALVAGGVEPGDRVAAQIGKSPEAIALYLGTLAAGGVFLPLNTAYTPAEVTFFLEDAEPKAVVIDPAGEADLAPVVAKLGARLFTLNGDGHGTIAEAADGAAPLEPRPRAADDLAAILYTSGTTGRSKGAMLSHANLASNASTLLVYWRFTGSDVLLHALPIFHTHGLFVATNTLMLAGGTILFLKSFDAARMIELMPQATAMMGVPTFYTRLLADPAFTKDVAAHMRLFISGSAPLSAETHKDFAARTGHAILERYGMTETNMSTSNPYEGERRPGTVGFPLPGVELRVTDPETGAEVPEGEVGVLEVRGPNVFKGYWRLPEKTAEEFREDGFFITGDLGRIDEQGYVQIVGRDKDLIITGGFNVYPAEVEGVLDAVDGVAESAVIGVPHPDFGEGVTAVLVRAPGASVEEGDVIAAVRDRLAKFKQPKRVLFETTLPRNAMGKIQKTVLRDRYRDLYA